MSSIPFPRASFSKERNCVLAEGEPDIIRRALAPLLDNAHRHAASAVVLEVAASADTVSLSVRDDGPGLPPELTDDAFHPGTRGTSPGSAGLGLPLSRRLTRSCGGDITPGPGPGGHFILTLPAIRGKAPESPPR